MAKPYILNVRSGVLHKRPTTERCNADDIKVKRDAGPQEARIAAYRRCRWCFGLQA